MGSSLELGAKRAWPNQAIGRLAEPGNQAIGSEPGNQATGHELGNQATGRREKLAKPRRQSWDEKASRDVNAEPRRERRDCD